MFYNEPSDVSEPVYPPPDDRSLYDHAWNRVRDFRDYSTSNAFGVGIHEARHWHQKAYGGLGHLGQMLPNQIGHAAAYEAYRSWIHHKSTLYEPLSGDMDRQREGLIGLAVAEATKLLQYTPRSMDPYTRRTAAEAAAATASQLFFYNRFRDEDDFPRGRTLGSRRGSYDEYDPYAYDTDALFSRRHRSYSRHRSRSPSFRHPLLQYSGSHASSTPMPIPSVPGSVSSSSGYSGHVGSYGSYGSPYNGGMLPSTSPGYASSAMTMPGSSYYPNGGYQMRPRSTSMNMGYGYVPPQTQYVNAGGVVSVPTPGMGPQTQLVVYSKPHKKHRHHKHRHHRHQSRHRSRSSDPGYDTSISR
ncbi:hypothetical protein VNI00_012022 [Paramarasmius palmivorus]|uniref:Uncharacterized protein n=1 Tax=Paramarasmius palmivorus TaxID=297713 RepID=A0AAW0C9H4_9AGAR